MSIEDCIDAVPQLTEAARPLAVLLPTREASTGDDHHSTTTGLAGSVTDGPVNGSGEHQGDHAQDDQGDRADPHLLVAAHALGPALLRGDLLDQRATFR